jgi:hypothetical protein
MPIMSISKVKALDLLDRQITLLHEKRRTVTYSSRSYEDYHGTYHGAVVLLTRLFDADAAEAFRRQFTPPPLPASLRGSPERDIDDYDEMLGKAILLLERRQDAIRDSWPDDIEAGGSPRP